MKKDACYEKLFGSYSGQGVQLLQGTGTRGLATSSTLVAGQTVCKLSWARAITPGTALCRLQKDEKLKKGMLPRGRENLLDSLESGTPCLVKKESAWILLLVLQLLSELRDPKSDWLAYLQTLPAPPGSLVKAVCWAGCDATDLLFFSDAELKELQYESLAEAVRLERKRLSELHRRLFARPGAEHAVGLQSFIWAHCLVRSRALDLTGYPQEGSQRDVSIQNDEDIPPFRCRCMLPVLDLCNHAASANCHLSVTLGSNGEPRSVDLIANQDLAAGSELLLDYGDRPLSDFLQGYGFVPRNGACTSPREIYKEFGTAWQVLSVSGHAEGRMFQLSSIHIAPDTEGSPLELESGPVSMLFVVKDERCRLPADICTAPRVYYHSGITNSGRHPQSALKVGRECVDAEQERKLALLVAEECSDVLSGMPTSVGEDEEYEQRLDNAHMHDVWKAAATVESCLPRNGLDQPMISDSGTTGAPADESGNLDCMQMKIRSWYRIEHAKMALHFRLERKKLLQRVIDDLHAQANLVMGV